jgi:MGT family glycosyltransferase
MKRQHVAVLTLMGNGHLHPVLPLCTELANRGYRVSCPAIPRYASSVQASGAEVVVFTELPVDDALRAENEARSRLVTSDPSRLETSDLEWSHMTRGTRYFLSQVAEFYDQDPPDLILYNRYVVAGRILASRYQSVAVQFSPHFAYPGRTRLWREGVCENPEELVAYGRQLDSLLASHDVRTRDNLWHVERLNIHFIPREFQYRADLLDDRFFFSGSLLERPYESLWQRPRDGKPVVLISGYSGLAETKLSNSGYFKLFVKALADLPCRCVMSIGDAAAEALGSLPDNFELNRDASHLEILPHAALLACHGGMGSCLEALYNGVPVLVLPSSPYTEEVAYRVTQLGAGTLLSRNELSANTIRSTVSKMLCDTPLRERAKTLQQVFRRSGGAAAVVQRIDRFLRESQQMGVRARPQCNELPLEELASSFIAGGVR